MQDIQVPEDLDQWFADFLKQQKKLEKKRKTKKKLFAYGKWAAAIIILLVGINFFLVTNVDAYRIQWLHMFTSIQNKFTQIDLKDDAEDSNENIPDQWEGNYYLSYLPTGYRLSDSVNQDSIIALIYTNEEGKQIIFSQFNQSSSTRIDSESGEASYIVINGNQEAIYLLKKDTSLISWVKEEISFQISADIGRQELIKMAESLILEK